MLPRLLPLLALSGAAALLCETVWLRRLALATGSAGLAATLTLAVYMAGLGLGGALAGRRRRRRWHRPPAAYGALELAAAAWTVLFPLLLAATRPLALSWEGLPGAALIALLLLLPPAVLHGATLPAAAAALRHPAQVAALYAVNTAGAVAGCLLGAFFLMPAVGVRSTELIAALLGAAAGLGALHLAHPSTPSMEDGREEEAAGGAGVSWGVAVAAGLAGGGALALEVAWSRLAALLVGGSVYGMAVVLAVFLAGVALGAAWGRGRGAALLRPALALLGLLAVAGTAAWRWLPHGLALSWQVLEGSAGLLPGAVLMAAAMAGAPIASGAVFSASLQAAPEGADPARVAGQVLAANTLGAVLGVTLAGLWGLPLLGIRGLVLLIGTLCVLGAAFLPLPEAAALGGRRMRLGGMGMLAALVLLTPRWDPAVYAVGVYSRLHEFSDLSPRSVEGFVRTGWTLRFYQDGRTASVAVGESDRTGNRWLSLNGKVDASTGADMPTQQLSGILPVLIHGDVREALVVGLASGVTAAEALQAGAARVTVIELEPAVVEAAAWFSSVNADVLDDPRAEIRVDDARAYLARPGRLFSVIISEPSNPWLTGVSNLFTREYWLLARERLEEDGVFCQWLQLYALPPQAMRSLIRTFLDVFPQTWLFETIPGADALLIASSSSSSPHLPPGLPLQPTLGPSQLRRLAGRAPHNTDDMPWIEFEAPRWLHTPTGPLNQALLEEAAGATAPH